MRFSITNRYLRGLLALPLCLTMAFPSAASAESKFLQLLCNQPEATTVKKLAKRLDRMEHHLDECGSIVIKSPDVWGESRLMRHRSDVETQLRNKLGSFGFRINAIQSTRDAAFLATAVALQEAITGNDVTQLNGTATPASGSTPATNANNVNAATAFLIPDSGTLNGPSAGNIVGRNNFLPLPTALNSPAIEPVIELDQLNRYLQHLNELRRLNEGDDNSDTPGYALNLVRIPVSILPGRKTKKGFGAEVQITIEPYMSDEILPLAFKDFVIKGVVDRIGFDVFQIAQRADIRSLKADITPDDSSPPTNNPIHASPTSSYPRPTKRSDQTSKLSPRSETKLISHSQTKETHIAETPEARSFYQMLRKAPTSKIQRFQAELDSTAPGTAAVKANLIDKNETDLIQNWNQIPSSNGKNIANQVVRYRLLADVNHRDVSISSSNRNIVQGETLLPVALHVYQSLVSSGASAFPTSEDEETKQYIPRDHRLDHGLTMPEVDTLLTRESEAAYEFLSQPNAAFLWQHCTPELASKIREHRDNTASINSTPDNASVAFARQEYLDQLRASFPSAQGTVTESLSWHIIVESTLINERLVKDLKETSAIKNCPCIPTEWVQFFGPDPSLEARHAFSEYVKCKWPIHVFALDPVTQDQNVSDSFSQRREMQMAMAIAASNRLIGGQAMARFVRRMEYDLESIQLNRTAIAFSHGDNTFGWRFFPRIQAPPVPGNLQAITHDLLIGGQSRDSLSRTYDLEAGIRECTALVVMPSFVPQVIVDVRTNWFRLAKHAPLYSFMKRKPDYEDCMDLSREIVELRELHSQCTSDEHLYRDGELFRLCKAVKRLEDRLPLQTHNVSIPWENDLGGFEVFQSATQVLGPEIHGWYGAPGITVFNETVKRNALANLARLSEEARQARDFLISLGPIPTPPTAPSEAQVAASKRVSDLDGNVATAKNEYTALLQATTDTAIFLVGKNFSVLNCRVIAGGFDATNTIEVINRNLMQVRIPSNVSTVSVSHDLPEQQYVVVHLATPYGATSRLLIPVAGSTAAANVTDAARAQKAAEAAATSAKDAAVAAQKLIARFPIRANWGATSTDRNCDIHRNLVNGCYQDNICEGEDKQLLVYQDLDTDKTFDEPRTKGISGLLKAIAQVKDSDKKYTVGPYELNSGLLATGDILTASVLYATIRNEIREQLPRKKGDKTTITVTGYVKVADDNSVIRLDDPITFNVDAVEDSSVK